MYFIDFNFINNTQFSIPIINFFCYDIRFCKELKLPNFIENNFNNNYTNNFNNNELDYIYSYHCLKNVDNWIETLKYWIYKLKPGGMLFFYIHLIFHMNFRDNGLENIFII